MMSGYTIKNLDRLRELLENCGNRALAKVYTSLVGSKPVSARLGMYEHPGGCSVIGKPGRWWVYVRIVGSNGVVYDAALWKLMRFKEVQSLLRDAVSTADEEMDKVLT